MWFALMPANSASCYSGESSLSPPPPPPPSFPTDETDETTPMKPAPIKPAKKRSIGITTLLSAIIAGLVLLSAGLVLALSTQTAWRNTSELLNAQTELAMTLIEEEIRGHVNPALEISRYLHNQVAPVSRLNPAGAGIQSSRPPPSLLSFPQSFKRESIL